MKFLLAFIVVVAAVVFAADEDSEQKDGVKTYRRLIPADVLRDFPGMCFASTKCATIEPNKTWDLTPFCGRSTCIQDGDRLYELVEDCGPLPIANPKCKLSDKTEKTSAFPACCPKFECEEGVKLEYPEIPTVKPETAEEEAAKTEAPKVSKA